ncbi:MAG: hypothetical protein AAB365_01485 [Patescibacteria group bacterium]
MDIMIGKRKVRVGSLKAIGKGGEADILDLGSGLILKLFKTPDHPDYAGDSPELKRERKGAEMRLKQHQQKLPAFPKGLPARVVTPVELATVASGPGVGSICGYTMNFVPGAELMIRYSQKDSRLKGFPTPTVVAGFKDLHATVGGIHRAGVVIGDFNDLNGLVKGDAIHLIDADSMQFGRFFCTVFTQKFVDPTLCDPKGDSPLLVKPHNENSDWYAFAALLMQSLLFVGPYGGVYIPKAAKDRVNHDARSLHRITVFDPEVRYPKPAVHWSILPDDLLQQFHRVFKKDERGEFPRRLLDGLNWQVCPKCSLEHARFACPVCQPGAIGVVKQSVEIRGTVKATKVYMNRGVILAAVFQGGSLRYLEHDNNQYRREDGTVVLTGALDARVRCRISGDRTIIAKEATAIIFDGAKQKERLTIDMNGTHSLVDSNQSHYYFGRNGQILRDADMGHEHMGDILQGQTLFWVGPAFGFGFYWAGRIRTGFVFDAKRSGMNDSVKLPPMPGQLIDTSCYFSSDRAWFLWSAQENGRRVNHCVVVRPTGAVEGHAQAEDGDGSWLGTIRGKCATGNVLLCATDQGIIQVKHDGATIAEAKRYPDTEPFVSSDDSLIVGADGLYVVSRKEMTLLRIT